MKEPKNGKTLAELQSKDLEVKADAIARLRGGLRGTMVGLHCKGMDRDCGGPWEV